MLKTLVRILCLLLACGLVAAQLAACGTPAEPDAGRDTESLPAGRETEPDTDAEPGTETKSESPTDTETETDRQPDVPDPEKPDGLKLNLLSEAWNVPSDGLRFFWRVPELEDDTMQQAYRIVIGAGADALDSDTYVYDSGWVDSSDSTGVTPAGLDGKLEDGRAYAWSVAVRTASGKESAFAEPFPFVTAPPRSTYPAIWASRASESDSSFLNAEDLGDFTLEAEFTITASALGILFRSFDANNAYMWQFMVKDGVAQFNPHVFSNGAYVGNAPIDRITVPSEVSFGIGDTIRVRIDATGQTVTTYLAEPEGDYVEIDSRDMSDYGFANGTFGFRTGGSESGTVRSLDVYSFTPDGEGGLVYSTDFSDGISRFPGCTVSDGALQVPRALSKGSRLTGDLDTESGSDSDEPVLRLATDSFAFFRRTFSLEAADLSAMSAAVLEITADSPEPARQHVYQVYCNGTCLGVGPARVGKNGEGQNVLYLDAYGILPLLKAGENVIAVFCNTTSGKRLYASLSCYDGSGRRSELFSTADPSSWQSLAADPVFRPDQSLGTAYYKALAENLDASLYPYGFAEPGFSQEGWYEAYPAGRLGSSYVLIPGTTSPVLRVTQPSGQATVERIGNDYVIDLGQEIVGSFGLSLTVPNECEIELFFGERLNADGTVMYRMNTGNVYYEKWKLRAGAQDLENFDMMCYRYVQISGCPVEITPDMVRGIEIRSAFDDDASSLSSDSALLLNLWDLGKATAKYTTQNLFVDSQTRERTAYEGDALINQLVVAACSDDYTAARFSIEYLLSHRTWPAEYVLLMPIVAYDFYMRTGDLSAVRDLYPALRNCQYTDRLDRDLSLLRMEVKASSSTDSILVDWPKGERAGYDMDVEYNTVFNALAVASYRALSALALDLGLTQESEDYDALADELTGGLILHLYDSASGRFRDGLKADGTPSGHFGQHATAFSLYAGVYNSSAMRLAMVASIAGTGRMECSVFGAFFLLEGLYRSDAGDLADELLLSEATGDTHTWAHMLSALDATLSAEAWDASIKGNLSLSHPWGATPIVSAVSGIFGIRPTAPGFAAAEIRLQPGELTSGSLRTPTLRGEISVSYRFEDGIWNVDVTVPSNMEAVLLLPWDARDTLVTLNGKGAGFELRDDGFVRVDLCCGAQSVSVGTSGPTEQ